MNSRLGMTVRYNLNFPYLLKGEVESFKKLRKSGTLSFFRVQLCARVGCPNEVPKIEGTDGKQAKPYCCKACYEAAVTVQGDAKDVKK